MTKGDAFARRRSRLALALVVASLSLVACSLLVNLDTLKSEALAAGVDAADAESPTLDASSDAPLVDAPDTGSDAPAESGDPLVGASIATADGGSADGGKTIVELALPSGTTTADFMWAVCYAAPAAATIAPAGWTAKVDQIVSSSRVWMGYKVATSFEPASYDFTITGSGPANGALVVYSGVNPTAPIDVDTGSSMVSGNPFAIPPLTTTNPGDILLASLTNVNGAGATWTAPTGMRTVASTGNIGIFDGIQVVAGPVPSKAATSTASGSGVVELAGLTVN
jgi:hypothetical protein